MSKRERLPDREFHVRTDGDFGQRIDWNIANRLMQINDWWILAAETLLRSPAAAVNDRAVMIFSVKETQCWKCHKAIPEGSYVLDVPIKGTLCPTCYLERWGDKGRVANILKDLALKEDLRVMTVKRDELAKETMFLDLKAKVDQLLTERMYIKAGKDALLRKSVHVHILAEDYFIKYGYAPAEQKTVFERLKQETDMFHEELEKLKQEDEKLERLTNTLKSGTNEKSNRDSGRRNL